MSSFGRGFIRKQTLSLKVWVCLPGLGTKESFRKYCAVFMASQDTSGKVPCRWHKRRTHQVTWFWIDCLWEGKNEFSDNEICLEKQTHMTCLWEQNKAQKERRCAYGVWDVANSVHPHLARYRKCVHPVQWDLVLVFQQMSTIYCHLQARTSMTVTRLKLRRECLVVKVPHRVSLTLKTSSCTRMMVSKGAPCL